VVFRGTPGYLKVTIWISPLILLDYINCNLNIIIIIIIIIFCISFMQGIYTYIPEQTISLGNIVLQLF